MKQEKRRPQPTLPFVEVIHRWGYELMNTDSKNQKGAFIMQATEREPIR